MLATVAGLSAWVCPTAACRARQLAHAIVVTDAKGQKVCKYVPLPSQVPLYESTARNILWGGQAGPGKSTGARWWLYDRSLRVPGHEALLLRENWDELDKTHLRKMEREVPELGGRFWKADRKASFGKGSEEAVIDCGHMAEADAVSRYLSTEYGAIVPDEASQYPVTPEGETPLAELSTRARKVYTDRAGAVVPPKFVPVTNPGGPSAAWLRDLFIDHAPDFERYPQLRGKYDPAQWLYLPAALDDNPYLDPEYETALAHLSKWRYEQLRHGDWTVFAGQFFSEWTPHRHVRALDIGPDVEWFASLDWGYNAPGVVLWWACLPDGHYHIARELKFQGQSVETVATAIAKITRELEIERLRYLVADPAIWQKTGHGRGESVAETLQRRRLPMRKGDNDRLNGWLRCHELLADDAAGEPWLTVDPACRYGVRSVPAQMSDKRDPDDLDTGGDDHWVDAFRYGAMSRPSPTRFVQQAKKLHPWLEDAIAGSSERQVLGASNVRARVS